MYCAFLFIESSSLIQIVVNSNQNRMILLYPSYYKYGMYKYIAMYLNRKDRVNKSTCV